MALASKTKQSFRRENSFPGLLLSKIENIFRPGLKKYSCWVPCATSINRVERKYLSNCLATFSSFYILCNRCPLKIIPL